MRNIRTIIATIPKFVWLVSLIWILGVSLIIGHGIFNESVMLSFGLVFMLTVPLASSFKIHRATMDLKALLKKQEVAISRLKVATSSSENDSIHLQKDTRISTMNKPFSTRVAIFGNGPLRTLLSRDFRPVFLSKGIAKAVFTVEQPEVLVIDEAVVASSQEHGGDKESDKLAFQEVLEVYNAAVALELPIFVVPSRDSSHTLRSLRNGAIVIPGRRTPHLSAMDDSHAEERELQVLYQVLRDFAKAVSRA